MSKGSFKTTMGTGGTLQAKFSDGGSEKKKQLKDRGPGWRARQREAQAKEKEAALEKRKQRQRSRRRDRTNVRGRGR